jgi:CubicO group peptidase (beta-lactamase class C family)
MRAVQCAVLVACLTATGAAAQTAEFADPNRRSKLATAFPEIDRLFAEFAERTHVPGAAWGLLVDGELVHAGATGVRELASKSRVDADTVFRIASMTKSFTAMAILKLRDEGKLSLDDPAERHVPELKSLRYPTTDSPRITIRHLLTHSEGFQKTTRGAISNWPRARRRSRA